MAWTVNDHFNFVNFLTRKNQTASITPTEFFSAWNSEQRSYQCDLLGNFQRQSNDKSGPNTGLIENDTILSKLSPFTTSATISVAVTGNATKPSNLLYRLAIRSGNHKVQMINKGQIYAMLADAIDAPSVANGIFYGTEYDTFYKIWPATTSTIAIDYIRNCVDVVWGYTTDGNGRPVYNAGTSVQPEWRDIDAQEITKRALRLFGLSFSSQDMQNFANQTINNGA
jgi:hypothetical protein